MSKQHRTWSSPLVRLLSNHAIHANKDKTMLNDDDTDDVDDNDDNNDNITITEEFLSL